LGDGADIVTLSDAAGANTVNLSMGAGNDTITLATTLNGGTFTFNGGAGTDNLNVSAAGDMSAQTITLTDINTITFDATGDIFEASVLSGATLTVKGDGNVADLLGATETTAAQTLDFSNITIDNTLATGAGGLAITTNNGVNSVTGSGGADTIVGGTGIDTLIGGAGGDTFTGGASNDVITGGEGGDTINANGGTDSISLAESTAAADTVTLDGGKATITSFDVGGTATDDDIKVDVSGTNTLVSDKLATLDGAVMGASAVTLETITGATTLPNTADDVLVISGNVADNAALETALEVGGTFQLIMNTGGTTLVAGTNDTILVLYDDGANSYLTAVNSAAGNVKNTTFAATDLTATTLATFTGQTDCTKILAADFAAIIA
jgi:Ca2+-binding RTX toxin-like protein